MKKVLIWFMVALLAFGTVTDGFAISFTRYGPNGAADVTLPPVSKLPESEKLTPEQLSGDRQLAIGFVKELIGRMNDNEVISFNDGLRLFHGNGLLLEFQLLRQLGYIDESGIELKPVPKYSCFGMLLKMNKSLFLSVAGETPVVAVTDLSSSGSTDGKTSASAFKVVLSYHQKNAVLEAVSADQHGAIIFDVHVKTFGKGEQAAWGDFDTALVNGKNIPSLLGFRTMAGKIPSHGREPSLSPRLYTLQEDELLKLKDFIEKSVKSDD